MSYLVDTNAWIGFFEGKASFGKGARNVMSEQPWDCYISKASIWEAAIKMGVGKLNLPYDIERDLPRLIDDNGFQILDLSLSDVSGVQRLEPIHGDPFDRIQVVQTRRRQWQIISRDRVFDRYELTRIW